MPVRRGMVTVVACVVMAGCLLTAIPPGTEAWAAPTPRTPISACSLLSPSQVTQALGSVIRRTAGTPVLCVYEGSHDRKLVVSDVPKTTRARAAVRPAMALGATGPRHPTTVGSIHGYLQAWRSATPGLTGTALIVTHRGYLIAVESVGIGQPDSVLRRVMAELLSHF